MLREKLREMLSSKLCFLFPTKTPHDLYESYYNNNMSSLSRYC